MAAGNAFNLEGSPGLFGRGGGPRDGRDGEANDSGAGSDAEETWQAAYELEAFKPNLTRTEADKRIAMLTAKLKLLDGPPHTL